MALPCFRLDGQTALVTGGAQGIGRAISEAFLAAGASVLIGDIDAAEAERTAGDLHAAGHCQWMPLDVSDEAEVDAAVAIALERLGRIDVLVNNAGINVIHDRVTIDQFTSADWRRILSVDLDGLFYMSRAVSGAMRESGGGRIVNIASVLGLVPARLQSAYVAAKAAVINLTRSMAIELAPANILVNAIAPGSTLTAGTRQLFYGEGGAHSEQAASLLSHIPLGRPGEPAEIAAAALFLVSPAASYITGAILPVDGGWTAGYIRDW